MTMVASKPPVDLRVKALRRFALSITIFNLVGRGWFGFEGAWSQLFVAVVTAYTLETVFEVISARASGRRPRFLDGPSEMVNFYLPAHITSFAVAMLLYATDLLLPYMFATAIAISAKYIFTAPVGRSRRHFLNPSNTGIVVTAILFPSIQITVPYQFTENLFGMEDILLPLLIIGTGTLLNWKLTQRMPLIIAWVASFAILGAMRSELYGFSPHGVIGFMSGVAFILFSFYMISDPGTTPSSRNGQIFFGFSVALVYNIWVMLHQPFGIFYALLIVCSTRGAYLNIVDWLARKRTGREMEGAPVASAVPSLHRTGAPPPVEPVIAPAYRSASGSLNTAVHRRTD